VEPEECALAIRTSTCPLSQSLCKAASRPSARPKAETPTAPVMEIEIGDAHVWIWRDADIGMATAILRALQTASRAK